MTFGDISLTIVEDATGANGDMSWNDRVNHVSDCLLDWVYEYFVEHGIPLNYHIQDRIRRIIGIAMIHQYDYDAKHFREIYTTTNINEEDY
jgi:hypothetical protein